jgi:hypothetical protein
MATREDGGPVSTVNRFLYGSGFYANGTFNRLKNGRAHAMVRGFVAAQLTAEGRLA